MATSKASTLRRSRPPSTLKPKPIKRQTIRDVWCTIQEAEKARIASQDLERSPLKYSKKSADQKALDKQFQTAHKTWNAALVAVGRAIPTDAREAAEQLSYLCETMKTYGAPGDEAPWEEICWVSEFDLKRYATRLAQLTELPRPTKQLGKRETAEGKLTADGLLHRYHAYLALELQILGDEIYGSAAYARRFMPLSNPVQSLLLKERKAAAVRRGLARRASIALETLGIDTVHGDGPNGRRCKPT